MKKLIPILLVASFLSMSSSVFARGGYYPHTYHHGHHGYSGFAGVAAGLLLGTIITFALLPQPPTGVYAPRYQVYPPEVIVQRPRVCVEERKVSGEWQQNPSDGTKIWVSFPYPMKRAVQVPCY